MGAAYKPDVSDDRESASLEVVRWLERRGAQVAILEPFVPRERLEGQGFTVAELADLGDFDLAVVLTDHSSLPFESVAATVPVVFDTRGCIESSGSRRQTSTLYETEDPGSHHGPLAR